MGKNLSSESARARSQKQQKQASRRAAPDARERIPPTGAGGAARSYHFYVYGAYQRFNSNQKQRPSRQSYFRTLLGQVPIRSYAYTPISLLSLLQRDEFPQNRTCVNLPWTVNRGFPHRHFFPIGDPTWHSAYGEKNGEEV